jgi:hypothetical protein
MRIPPKTGSVIRCTYNLEMITIIIITRTVLMGRMLLLVIKSTHLAA